VASPEARLTYGELDLLANRLAHRLVGLGVGPDVVVALYAGRSTEQILGALAILKAGGAYLPLDASYPVERIAFILDDARCRFMLCAPELAESMAHRVENTIVLDPKGPRAAIAPASRVTADHLAYVIYTSGSTGTPKGVLVTHDSLRNFLLAMQEHFPLDPNDRLLAVTTVGFDIAALELFLPLLSGARLVIAPKESVQHPPTLGRMIKKTGTTILQATPALWNVLVASNAEELQSLRILVGGEALPSGLCRALRGLSGQLPIHGAGNRRLHDRKLDVEQLEQTPVWPHIRTILRDLAPYLITLPLASHGLVCIAAMRAT